LLSYRDVKAHARQIVEATGQRYMPPWPPQPGYGEFKDTRRLTDSQIQLIADWVRAGSPEGDPALEPPQPRFATEWSLGQPDLVMEAARPFAMRAAGPMFFGILFLRRTFARRALSEPLKSAQGQAEMFIMPTYCSTG
jgi:hypothetical protein